MPAKGVPAMPLRLILVLVGLLVLFTTIACESFNQTQTAEAPTKEAEKALDEKRKDADLPSCDDMDYDVKQIVEDNLRLTGGWEIDDLDNREIIGVVVNSSNVRITCRAEAQLKNDERGWIRYVGEKRGGRTIVTVFPFNAFDTPDGTPVFQDEPTATVIPTPTIAPTPPASFATRMAVRSAPTGPSATSAPRPTSTLRGSVSRGGTPSPSLTPSPTPEIQQQEWLMPGQRRLVGGDDENDLVPGTYEYRDYDGGVIVTGQFCSLFLNYDDSDRTKLRRRDLQKGQPFRIILRPQSGMVYLDGGGGPYHDGCTDTINVSGEGLYRVGD